MPEQNTAIPADPANVEFVGDNASGSGKTKLKAPAKSPITSSVEAQEATGATSPHVPPVNVTTGSQRPAIDTFSGGQPVTLNAIAGTANGTAGTGGKFVLDERGNTMDAETLSASTPLAPHAAPVLVANLSPEATQAILDARTAAPKADPDQSKR